MELTISIDLAHASAKLVEKHALVAGDVYNPLFADFSGLNDQQIAEIETGSLVLTLRRGGPSGQIIASSNTFSAASRLTTNGQSAPCPKMRQTTLLLNTRSVRDWFDAEAGLENPNMMKTVYLELSDASVTYAACEIPFILRSFTVGGTNPGYYTKEEVDALLREKMRTLSFSLPLLLAGGNVSVRSATESALGVVKIGRGLSVSTDGTVSATDQSMTVDSEFDENSMHPVQNKVVAAAVAGLLQRLGLLDGESGRVSAVEQALGGKADTSSLATVATSGSYNDLFDKPEIPSLNEFGNKWYTGTAVTGTSSTPSSFPGSGIASARAGDLYLNTSTANVYVCTTPGVPSVALWAYRSNLKGSQGDEGVSGRIAATYSSVPAMQAAWATDNVRLGELVIIDTESAVDADNGKLYRKGPASYEYLCDLSGNPGSAWYVGTSITGQGAEMVFPSTGISSANVGDIYLNSSTSFYYRCVFPGPDGSAKWTYCGSLKGDTGDPGATGLPGSSWYHGTAMIGTSINPVVFSSSGIEDARVGDKYLNTSTGFVYSCMLSGAPSTATWAYIANLKGGIGDAGTAGDKWFFGTELSGDSPSSSIADGTPKAGDCYVNTSSGDVYRCSAVVGVTPTWARMGCIRGTDGSDGADGRTWHYGTTVTGTAPMQASVTDGLVLKTGDLHFNTTTHEIHVCSAIISTDTGTWTYLTTIESAGVTAPESHTSGYIPAWGIGNVLTAGYEFISTDETRQSSIASSTAVPSEYSVALALLRKVTAPTNHSADTIPAWGDSATNTLAAEYAVRNTVAGGIRSSVYASDAAIPTEKTIRAALDELATRISELRLDELAAPLASSVRLDATQSVHGLMSKADKKKLDGLVDYNTALDIGEDLADDDTLPVYNASENNPPRIMAATRLWAYVMSKLPSFGLDKLGVPGDNTALNVNVDHHGLCPKLPASQGDRKVLSGTGEWVYNEAANTFTGDFGSGGTRGQVPAPSPGDGAASKFLCADGSWAVVPGGQQYTDWTFSDTGPAGDWVLAWDEGTGNWTATDGTRTGTMSGTYGRTATTVVFSYVDGQTYTVTATRSVTSGVNIHSLDEVAQLDGTDEILLHDTSAGEQGKVSMSALASFVQNFNRYDTLFVPAGAMTPAEVNGASPIEIYVSANGTTHDAMRFPYSGTIDTNVDFNVMFPDDWDFGTVKAKLVWRLNSVNTAVPDTNVKFGICARAFGDTEDYSSSMGESVFIIDTLHGTSEIHVTDASPELTVGGTPAKGKMVHFRVTRTFSSVTDSLGADVNLLGVLFQYRRSGVQTAW